jgi:NAD(P)H-dependent FMN reductase
MNQINVLVGTNRENSFTSSVARYYHQTLQDIGIQSNLIEINDVPFHAIDEFLYKKGPNPFREYAHELFIHSPKLVIVSPEYNGSYPGILKLLLDACEPPIFKGKKIALIGVASGRAGNLRGMDQLALVLNYLKMEVYSQKIPISGIYNLVDENRNLVDNNTQNVLKNHAQEFLNF